LTSDYIDIASSNALDSMETTLRTMSIGQRAKNHQSKAAEFMAGSKFSENACKTKNEISNEPISGK